MDTKTEKKDILHHKVTIYRYTEHTSTRSRDTGWRLDKVKREREKKEEKEKERETINRDSDFSHGTTCYLLAWMAVVAARFDRVSRDDLDDGSSPAAAAAAAGWPRASFVWASSFAPRHLWPKSLTPRSGLAAAAAPDVGGWWTVIWTEYFTGERFTGAVLLAVVTVMLVLVVVVGLAWWRGRWGGAVVARKARTYCTRNGTIDE